MILEDPFFTFAIPLLFGGFIGYAVGKSTGWRAGVDECFDPFWAEGYYSGWIARHHRAPLEDTRVHPDVMKRFVPSLRDPDQEILDWMRHWDHLPFEEYRKQQVAKLNTELEL